LFKSTDSGRNWGFSYGYRGPQQLHVDHHALAFHPNNPDYMISGNDGGINISEDGGVTWSLPSNLPITQFYEIGLDKTNPSRYYGGTQDNNTVRTLSGDENNWSKIYGGDGFYVIIDPNNPNIIYAEAQFGRLVKSSDGGSSFFFALNGVPPEDKEPRNWSTPVVMDPNNSNTLYYGTHTLYRSENGSENWKPVSPKLTNYNSGKRLGTITTIAVAPTNSNTIYVGTDDSKIWVSTDYGNTWENISGTLPFRWVTRITIDPKDENIVYVTFSGLKWADPEPRVFRSNDKGKNWINISSNLPDAPVNAFAVDNNNSNVLFLGNDVGAFISYNSGSSWEILGSNLPVVVVNDMKIHPADNYLAIGTHGRGMYKIDLNELREGNNQLPNWLALSQNFPNPFNPGTTISYSIPKLETNTPSVVQLIVYDILGKKIISLLDRQQNPGNYSIKFDGSKYGSGVYIYKLIFSNTTLVKKMILLK